MLSGLYSAATSTEVAALNQEAVADNLAHARMPGYRRQGFAFQTFLQAAAPDDPNGVELGHGTQASQLYTDFTPGPIEQTGNPLDVAIVGDAFFVVQGPGGPMLTKNGAFRLNEDNQLQTVGGYLVQGEGGTVTLPNNAARITIAEDGRILADDQPVDRLRLVTVADPTQLQRAGDTLFRGNIPPGQQDNPQARVLQGHLEGSNVQVVQEMVSMMLGMRHYEASQRAMKSIADSVAKITQPE